MLLISRKYRAGLYIQNLLNLTRNYPGKFLHINPIPGTRSFSPGRHMSKPFLSSWDRLVPGVVEAMKDPIRMPITNIHCQSIWGTSLIKKDIWATLSGPIIFSITPKERTKVVEAPRYFPAIQTDRMDNTPPRGPTNTASAVLSIDLHKPRPLRQKAVFNSTSKPS